MKNIILFLFTVQLLTCWKVYSQSKVSVKDSIEYILSQTTDKNHQIEILIQATLDLKASDPDIALEFGNRALTLAEEEGSEELKLQAMVEVGAIMAFNSQFLSSLKIILEAKELALKLNKKKELGKALMTIGMIRVFLGDYEDSYQCYFDALQSFEEIGFKQGIVMALNGIGNICYSQKNLDKASIYYSKALKTAREIKDELQIANVVNNVGLVFEHQKQYQKAIACYEEAITINQRKRQMIRLGTNYMNRGNSWLNLGRSDKFLADCNQAIDIFTSLGNIHHRSQSYLSLSDFYELKKEYKFALKYSMSAFNEGQLYKLKGVIYMAAERLHGIYKSTDNVDSAYKYSIIKSQAKDNLDKEHSLTQLSLVEAEYRFDKEQKEQKLRQQRRNFYIIIVFILAVSGLVTTFLFLSRQIVKTRNVQLEKQRLSEEVEFKNKELTLNVMNVIKKNELIVDISTKLIGIENQAQDERTKSEILHLVKSLQKSSGDHNWDEFETRFKQIHNTFYDKLLKQFPDLSPSELKLCALLKLNLSTKEICELSGQRPSSLDVARYRLRKKLGISNSQVNLVTFLSQV